MCATTVTRSSRRVPTWAAPSLVGVAGVATAAYVRLVDPATGGAFLPCPFHRLTGLWCPGCGLTRATHRLLGGDVLGALGANLFVPVVLGLLGIAWSRWWWTAVTGRSRPTTWRLPTGAGVGLIAALLAFGVLRNLPMAPLDALAP